MILEKAQRLGYYAKIGRMYLSILFACYTLWCVCVLLFTNANFETIIYIFPTNPHPFSFV